MSKTRKPVKPISKAAATRFLLAHGIDQPAEVAICMRQWFGYDISPRYFQKIKSAK